MYYVRTLINHVGGMFMCSKLSFFFLFFKDVENDTEFMKELPKYILFCKTVSSVQNNKREKEERKKKPNEKINKLERL